MYAIVLSLILFQVTDSCFFNDNTLLQAIDHSLKNDFISFENDTIYVEIKPENSNLDIKTLSFENKFIVIQLFDQRISNNDFIIREIKSEENKVYLYFLTKGYGVTNSGYYEFNCKDDSLELFDIWYVKSNE